MNSETEDTEKAAFRVLAPSNWRGDLDEFLRVARKSTQPPFAVGRIEVLAQLSRAILAHPRLRRDPAGAALSFWLRPAHVAELRADFERPGPPGSRRVPAGLVVNIAPANVDTMFILSWSLSFLVGNANIVRLTTNASPLMIDLLECLNRVFGTSPSLCEGNLFVTYGHSDVITGRLSEACDTRIIWGGDETVRRIRAIPLNPHAAERAFSSKRSMSVFASSSYTALDEGARSEVAGRMAADLAPFHQLACSSPQLVYWLGSRTEAAAASADFAARLESAMASRIGDPDAGWAARRIDHAFAAAAEGRAASLTHGPHSTAVYAVNPKSAEAAELCGGGYLIHVNGSSLEDLESRFRIDHQTVTYFGLDAAGLDRLAAFAGRAGVDRIVPVGRALDFSPQWDGYDLWSDLSRLLIVQHPVSHEDAVPDPSPKESGSSPPARGRPHGKPAAPAREASA